MAMIGTWMLLIPFLAVFVGGVGALFLALYREWGLKGPLFLVFVGAYIGLAIHWILG